LLNDWERVGRLENNKIDEASPTQRSGLSRFHSRAGVLPARCIGFPVLQISEEGVAK
jgi:hypothetical protein